MNRIDKLMNEQKFFRRLVLLWVLVLITDLYLFIRDFEFLTTVTGHGTTIVLAIFGMLATIIGFYQWHRKADDDLAEKLRKEQLELEKLKSSQ